jgi:hypothetical protein
MINISKLLIQGVAHTVFWLLGIFAALQLMAHSDARIGYGYLIGWWGALYCGFITNVKLPSSIVAFLIYLTVGILSVFFDWSWFYKGLPESLSIQYVITVVFGGVVFVSPILVNAMVRFVKKKL